MVKKTKFNYFKLIVILEIIAIVFLVIGIYNQNKKQIVNLSGLEMDKDTFLDLMNPMPEGDYELCSISENKCVRITKQRLRQ